ncbi:unnamed protein product [Thelazia callipaeda]|uniref:Gustatory receptor n=1 Tax=Thelazia callipaeda TaxID=103827 RepID=A0A0N5D750_THECL|nr:unnamed protein product [Thelazia callipaeda]
MYSGQLGVSLDKQCKEIIESMTFMWDTSKNLQQIIERFKVLSNNVLKTSVVTSLGFWTIWLLDYMALDYMAFRI